MRQLALWSMAITAAMVFVVRWWQWEADGAELVDAALFTLVLAAILGAHEAGHVILARAYGFRLGPPLFLPLPLWVGTLGALIQVRELPPDRRALLAMGAGGPLAGFAVIALASLAKGPGEVGGELSTPALFHLAGLFTGTSPGVSVGDPIGFAAWVGCLVTALNLLPVGQLDGGHVFSALFPGRESVATGLVALGLCALGVAWWPWLVWGVVVVLGMREPLKVRRAHPPPGPVEQRLAIACAIVWALCATPVPLVI